MGDYAGRRQERSGRRQDEPEIAVVTMKEAALAESVSAEVRKSDGKLERVLAAGGFAVTCETSPTATTDLAPLLERVAPLRNVADAVNVTDGATAKAHVSSLVLAGAMMQQGIQPVLQFTVRDRNLIALQGDLLGAGALGIPNILCLTGDDPKKGEEPTATTVFDLDSAGLMRLACKMRDEGLLNAGREIKAPPKLFIGCADAPMIPKEDWVPKSLQGKIEAGADFAQTQYCFDLETREDLFRPAGGFRHRREAAFPGRHRAAGFAAPGEVDGREPVGRLDPRADPETAGRRGRRAGGRQEDLRRADPAATGNSRRPRRPSDGAAPGSRHGRSHRDERRAEGQAVTIVRNPG